VPKINERNSVTITEKKDPLSRIVGFNTLVAVNSLVAANSLVAVNSSVRS
jgi:hypothetical protein